MSMEDIKKEFDEKTLEIVHEAYLKGQADVLKGKIVQDLVGALKGFIRNGTCSCEVANGNPMYRGEHSQACLNSRLALEAYGHFL